MMAKGLSAHGLWLTYLAQDHQLIADSLRAMQPWIEMGALHPEVGLCSPWSRPAKRIVCYCGARITVRLCCK